MSEPGTILSGAVRRSFDRLAPGKWQNVVFQNSWANFGTPFQTCQYRKTGDLVEVRGLMASGTNAVAAFTLPVGYRPPADLIFAAAQSPAGTTGRLTVASSGNVSPTNGSGGTNVAFSVNCSFSVSR